MLDICPGCCLGLKSGWLLLFDRVTGISHDKAEELSNGSVQTKWKSPVPVNGMAEVSVALRCKWSETYQQRLILCPRPIKRSRKGYLWLWSQTIEWNPVSFPLWKKSILSQVLQTEHWALKCFLRAVWCSHMEIGPSDLLRCDGDVGDVLFRAAPIKNPSLLDWTVFVLHFPFIPLLYSPFLHFSTLSSSPLPPSPPPLLSPHLEKTTGWICVALHNVSVALSPYSQT